jgi:two-component system OmpR family response regulator
MKLLVIEDDLTTAQFITRGLRESGHVADHAADGHEALMLATGQSYDVLIIDRMIPRLDGLSLLRALRAGGNHTPALFLSAMGSLDDRVTGLESGGDDYLVKPFAFAELLARVTALARRPRAAETDSTLRAGDIVVDRMKRSVTRDAREIQLLPTEYRLLEYLMRNAGKVVTRTMLLEQVWDFHFDPKTNIVETHISRLRAKIDRGFERERIRTVRGAGYTIDDTP